MLSNRGDSSTMSETNSGYQVPKVGQPEQLCSHCRQTIISALVDLGLFSDYEDDEDLSTSSDGEYHILEPETIDRGSDHPMLGVTPTREELRLLSREPCPDFSPYMGEIKVGPTLCSRDVVYNQHESVLNDSNSSNVSAQALKSGYSVLVRNGWWGAVGVEPNPGPGHKKSRVVEKPKRKKEIIIKQVVKKSSKKRSFGAKVGGFLGDLAQKAIMGITGMGDYKVTKNSLYDGAIQASSPPIFGGSDNGIMRFRKREYVGDIRTIGDSFNLSRFPITPSSSVAFPWLSQVAKNFEQFKFHGLVFEFSTASATAVASTNTALGKVILATQYNSVEPAFTSKLQMDQYQYAVSTVPSVSAIHPVECAPQLGAPEFLYLSEAGNYSGDQRWNQLGVFSIATIGQQAPANLGELWVSYDIELVKSRLPGNVIDNGPTVSWARWNTGGNNLASFSNVDPWNASGPNQRYIGNATNIFRFGPLGRIDIVPGYFGKLRFEITQVASNSTGAAPLVLFNLPGYSDNVTLLNSFVGVNGALTSELRTPSAGTASWSYSTQSFALNIAPQYNGATSYVIFTSALTYGLNGIQMTITPINY